MSIEEAQPVARHIDSNLVVWTNSGRIPKASARFLAREISSFFGGSATITGQGSMILITLPHAHSACLSALRNFFEH